MDSIYCENLEKSFGNGPNKTDAVRGVSYTFRANTFYSIIGKSGSGKSTLLYLLSGLLRPDSGKVLYDDVLIHDLSAREQERLRRQQIGFVFQDYQLLPELTVKENIILPQILDDREIDYDWCDQILETLEMTPHADKYPFELSGGQQQRTAIGRAIINRPRFLFTDEPTGNLDKQTSESVLNLFLKIHQMYDPMILVVTHDLDIARSADIVLHMEDGKLSQLSEESEDCL